MIDDLGDLPSSETMLPAKKQLPRSGLNVEQITLAANLAGMRRV
jgi:hypothetical protein